MNEGECWALGDRSDWCGEHDRELRYPDPAGPEMLVCERWLEAGWTNAWLAARLRGETCGLEGDDHGHTLCWLLNLAATKLEAAS